MSSQEQDFASFRKVAVASDRKFGLTLGVILTFIALWPLIRHHAVNDWLLAIGLGLFVLGLLKPALLSPLNRIWFRLGMVMAAIVNPIVMAILYFVVVTPIGWYLRKRNYDLLRLRWDHDAPSYWLARDDEPGSLTRQF